MPDFRRVLKTMQVSQKKRDRRERDLRKMNERFCARLQELQNICKPGCIKAIGVYNLAGGIQIVDSTIKISIDLKKRKIFLGVHVRLPTGQEPDESFDSQEIREIGSTLGAMVTAEMIELRMPLTFGGISVPSRYYMK
jgi:hypothetical protein